MRGYGTVCRSSARLSVNSNMNAKIGNRYITEIMIELIEIPTAYLGFDHSELDENVSKQLRQ